MLKKASHHHAISKILISTWYSHFRSEHNSAEDCPHSGRPSSSQTDENVEKANKIIHEERKCTINKVCNILGLSYGICQCILTEDLNITGKFVSHLPNDNMKKNPTFCKIKPKRTHTLIFKLLLFPKMKILIWEWRFKNTAEIQPKSQVVLNITIKLDFLRCFLQWQTHYVQHTNWTS